MIPGWRDRCFFCAAILGALLLGYFASSNAFLGIIATGLAYIGVFFHEIGHTVFHWLYGYVALPSFDFAAGGGMTYQFGGRSWLLQAAVFVSLGAGIFMARRSGFAPLMVPLSVFTAFLLLTAFLPVHSMIPIFMGHGTEIALGAFLLCRAYYNIWLSRPAERSLNALIGAFMISNVLTLVWALMYNPVFAAEYEMQKGGHRFGDLDQIEDGFGISRHTLGWTYIIYTAACLMGLRAWIVRRLP